MIASGWATLSGPVRYLGSMRTALLLVITLVVGCGGKVVDDGRGSTEGLQGARDDEPAEDAGATDAAKAAPPPAVDAGATDTTEAPPTDAGATPKPEEDTAPTTVDAGGGTVVCTDGPVTGSPGGCGAVAVCNAGDPVDVAWAQDLLSCYVDRCLAEQGRGAWCGEIGLTFGAEGCTTAYIEGGNSGGCVKYQGYYRRWPCLVGKTLSVTRPCN